MEMTSSQFSDKLYYYQSANNDNKSIKKNFVIRISEYQQIISALKIKKSKDPLQHELILGRRGSGKSTLLKRIQVEIEENQILSNKYIAINLAEEQSSIYRLFDLWLEVIQEFNEQFDAKINLTDYSHFKSDDEYTRYLYKEIHTSLKKNKKKLVLLVDNFDRIIENFTDDGNLLRETLINYNDIQLVAGSTRMSEHFWKYDQPFYEFFRRHSLEALSTNEMIKLILHWSNTLNIKELKTFAKHNKGKIEAVRILTDGLPRTLQFFIEILLDNSYLYGYEYLKKIMDKVTPIYQERLNTLPPQLRKIVTEMAFIWNSCTTKELVGKCKMSSKLISANLKTLVDKGIVTKIETGKKNHLYQISERFFNMWFIITQGNPKQKRKAKWLSIFLENWYSNDEFRKLTFEHIQNLKNNKITYDKAILISKAISQSKYTSLKQRDQIIELLENLEKTNKDCLIQLPKKYKEIEKEIKKQFVLKEYEKAIEIAKEIENEEDGIKFFILGLLYDNQECYKDAEKFYLKSIEKGNKDSSFNLGLLYDNQERYQDAEKHYLKAIEKGDVESLFNLGLLYDNQDRSEEAEKYYLKAIEKGDVNALNNLGLFYFKQERYQEAEDYYLKAVDKGSKNALFNLGLLYDKQDRSEEAEMYYLKAIEKGDEKAENNLGSLLVKQNRNKEAEEFYLKAIEKGNESILFSLGLFYNNQERFEEAEKYYLKAIGKDNVKALSNLGLLYYNQERYQEAEEYYLKAIEKKAWKALFNLGLLYDEQGRFDEAEKYYLKSIKKKNDESALFNLVLLCYLHNKKKEKALILIRQYNKFNKNTRSDIIQILIEIWNGIFKDIDKHVINIIKKNEKEELDVLLAELLVHKQKNLIFNFFNNPDFGEELKERYIVLYYVSALLVKPENNEIILTIPPEIKDTVDLVIKEIFEKQKFYGYIK